MAAVEVTVHVEHDSGVRPACSHFGTPCPGYDQRARTWRHLDTSQFKTLFVAAVPRMTCPTDGVVTIKVPWAKSGSGSPPCMKRSSWTGSGRRRFKPSPVKSLRWNTIGCLLQRAGKFGLANRTLETPTRIGIDETSFRKGHDYVTVVTDQPRGQVLHVADERRTRSLVSYDDTLPEIQKAGLESIVTDMCPADIKATLDQIPEV